MRGNTEEIRRGAIPHRILTLPGGRWVGVLAVLVLIGQVNHDLLAGKMRRNDLAAPGMGLAFVCGDSGGARRLRGICRLDSAQAFDPSIGLDGTIKKCVADEQAAVEQLRKQWPQFREADKNQCIGETKIGGTASYVDLLTCLHLAQDARQ